MSTKPRRRALRGESLHKTERDVIDFFLHAPVPYRVGHRALTQVVRSIKATPHSDHAGTAKLVYTNETGYQIPELELEPEPELELEGQDHDDAASDDLEELPQGLGKHPKRWVMAGIYSKPKKGNTPYKVLLPKALSFAPREPLIPYSIFCPTVGQEREVVKWKDLARNVWVLEPVKFRRPGDHGVCMCVVRCDEDCLNRLQQDECGISNCRFGEIDCGNRAFENKRRLCRKAELCYAKGFEVVAMGPKGNGLRAIRTFAPGELIVEYTGEKISHSEIERRLNTFYADEHFYFLLLEKGYAIDSGRKGSLARFANHSCDPNSKMQLWYVDSEPRVGLFAGREGIPPGVEIAYDYNFDWFPNAIPQECRCGAKMCRGTIGKSSDPVATPEPVVPPVVVAAPAKPRARNIEAVGGKPGETPEEVDLAPRRHTNIKTAVCVWHPDFEDCSLTAFVPDGDLLGDEKPPVREKPVTTSLTSVALKKRLANALGTTLLDTAPSKRRSRGVSESRTIPVWLSRMFERAASLAEPKSSPSPPTEPKAKSPLAPAVEVKTEAPPALPVEIEVLEEETARTAPSSDGRDLAKGCNGSHEVPKDSPPTNGEGLDGKTHMVRIKVPPLYPKPTPAMAEPMVHAFTPVSADPKISEPYARFSIRLILNRLLSPENASCDPVADSLETLRLKKPRLYKQLMSDLKPTAPLSPRGGARTHPSPPRGRTPRRNLTPKQKPPAPARASVVNRSPPVVLLVASSVPVLQTESTTTSSPTSTILVDEPQSANYSDPETVHPKHLLFSMHPIGTVFFPLDSEMK